MFLDQMPAARPRHDHGDLFVKRVFLAVRIRERNRAPDRVAQVDLTLDHVRPRRRVRVLEVGHKNLRAGVERINRHLAIGRARDLDPAVADVWRNRRALPISRIYLVYCKNSIRSPRSIAAFLDCRRARESSRRGLNARCSLATNASASGVRISANAGVTSPTICTPSGV